MILDRALNYLNQLLGLVFKVELNIVRCESALKIPPGSLNSLPEHHFQVLKELLLLPVIISPFSKYLFVASMQVK